MVVLRSEGGREALLIRLETSEYGAVPFEMRTAPRSFVSGSSLLIS